MGPAMSAFGSKRKSRGSSPKSAFGFLNRLLPEAPTSAIGFRNDEIEMKILRASSAFEFSHRLDPTETLSVLFYGPSLLLVVCKGGGSLAARGDRRS